MDVAVCRSDAVDLFPASSKIWQMRLDPVQRCAANPPVCVAPKLMSDWRWEAWSNAWESAVLAASWQSLS